MDYNLPPGSHVAAVEAARTASHAVPRNSKAVTPAGNQGVVMPSPESPPAAAKQPPIGDWASI